MCFASSDSDLDGSRRLLHSRNRIRRLSSGSLPLIRRCVVVNVHELHPHLLPCDASDYNMVTGHREVPG